MPVFCCPHPNLKPFLSRMCFSSQVAVQSCGVVACALRALAAVTEAVELDVNQVRRACHLTMDWFCGMAHMRPGVVLRDVIS